MRKFIPINTDWINDPSKNIFNSLTTYNHYEVLLTRNIVLIDTRRKKGLTEASGTSWKYSSVLHIHSPPLSCAYVHSSIVDCTSVLNFFLLIHSLDLIVNAFTCLCSDCRCRHQRTPYHSIAWLSDSRWKKENERTNIRVNFYSTHIDEEKGDQLSTIPETDRISLSLLLLLKTISLSLALAHFICPLYKVNIWCERVPNRSLMHKHDSSLIDRRGRREKAVQRECDDFLFQ